MGKGLEYGLKGGGRGGCFFHYVILALQIKSSILVPI